MSDYDYESMLIVMSIILITINIDIYRLVVCKFCHTQYD